MSSEGKVAIVTGAARGIGQGYAVTLAKDGFAVTVTDLRGCDETVKLVKAAGGKVLAMEADITKPADMVRVAEETKKAFGRIDVLVNNAAAFGNLNAGKFDAISEEEWDFCFDVNVKGMWNSCKAVVPFIREAGGGSIINIISMASVFGRPYFLHYGAAKGAVIGLTRALARELGRDNIRVNAIAPVMTMTPGMEETVKGRVEQLAEVTLANQSLRKTLEVEDQVGTMLYLASDQSKFVTGQTLMVDGGTVFL